MKVKNLIFSLITFSFLVFSCTQEEIVPLTPNSFQETMEMSTMAVNTPSTPKAYIFIEPQLKTKMIVDYLKTRPRSIQVTGNTPFLGRTPFYAFFTGVGLFNTNYTDLLNYINMPYWYNGELPTVIQSEIPQTTVIGVDNFGNPLKQYNFKTIKINKGTLGPEKQFGWVMVLIPVNAMANDAKRQVSMAYCEKNGNKIVSSANNTQTVINMNTMLYSYLIDYTGTRIPVGKYRVYSTYGSGSSLRIGFNNTNDVYLRGNSN